MSSKTSEPIPINSTTRTIQECFQYCLYEVPGFQRPYSWDIQELKDYWTDVVLAKGDFFFGSTVTWESKSRKLFPNTYSIIDGQQRLTTSAIVLSVIRDAFLSISESASIANLEDDERNALLKVAKLQADSTQKYLVKGDDDGNEFPVITRSEPNFREVVQRPSAIPSGRKWNGSAQQIGVAREYFENMVQKELENKPVTELVDTLKNLRNNVLQATVIQVELTTEGDGFLIFETLNTRGADLRLADLVKNMLIRGGAESADDRGAIAERWDRLIDRVQASTESTGNVDQFIWQSWNSRRPAVTEARLYKEISKLVGTSSQQHLTYLEELEFDSITYQYLEELRFSIDKSEIDSNSALNVPEVAETIRALAIFNVSVANSAILAIVRKYDTTKLMQRKQLVSACRAIESFHFQFTALLNSGSTGGTRGRYNRFAVELEKATSKDEVRISIDSFRDKLELSLPSSAEAKKAIAKLFYAPNVRLTAAQKRQSRKAFIAYILLRFAQHSKKLTLQQDLDAWTIEHIRPQKLASESVGAPEYSIGNLTLLTREANGDLGDGNLAEKRLGLRNFVLWQDDELSNWIENEEKTEVLANDINIRSKELADLAIDNIWSIR